MKKHINADFFKLLLAFLIICASFKPGLSDAATNSSRFITQTENQQPIVLVETKSSTAISNR